MNNATKDLKRNLHQLLNTNTYYKIPKIKALDHFGKLIDCSFYNNSIKGLQKAINLSEELAHKRLSSKERSMFHYFLSVAYGDLLSIKYRKLKHFPWKWQKEEFEKEIINLRLAIMENGFELLSDEYRCRIFTNLGNLFDTIGRFFDSLVYWEKALAINPNFKDAICNKAIALEAFSTVVYDNDQKRIFLKHALIQYQSALPLIIKNELTTSINKIEELTKKIGKYCCDCDCIDKLNKISLGNSSEEIKYRTWCLDNHIFLHPINELGKFSSAAYDFVSLPDIRTKLNTGMGLQGLFNQLKQEFVSARYMYYEGIKYKGAHFSDKQVPLINTLDYPIYCLNIEKIKYAYKTAYSLFDKIAYFLKIYYNIKLDVDNIYFRNIFFENCKKKLLWSKFRNIHNLPLRGLFWIYRDLHDKDSTFINSIEPEAQALAEIRNKITHGYLKVHEFIMPSRVKSGFLKDDLSLSISRRDLESKTLKLLLLARSAIIYLSFSVYVEERNRFNRSKSTKISIPVFQDIYKDEWKI